MKRICVYLAAAFLAIISATYYTLPHYFREPLIELNRGIAGLEEKTILVDRHEIHYLEGGSGDAVVLLHGIFAEKDHWVDFARPLTGSYHVIVPDLPGFGESSRMPDLQYDYAAQTELLVKMLDKLGIKRAHLAGNSMGGTIASLFAIKYPDRVASIAFIGAPHGIRSTTPSEMDMLIDAGKAPLVARNPAEFEEMLSLVFAKRPFLPFPIIQASQSSAINNAESNHRIWLGQLKDRYLLHERIETLKHKTLVLWGENDRVFDVSGAGVLKAKLSRAEMHVLHGIGHLPMMEAPKDTSGLYTAFLRKMKS
ncbi:alpha/beta hydrolase [Noviherbaspirillum sp. CPCC 100848]|uniref:Alpha/beta hydrolase n=1 Tax=Noviherbaspirillum album TaxID=3080276 RepID=A0ABU6J251_9BURK|nr:alpha/beta hydrolase [Noviherbaspirillum sp. CPCC 100848]MEC4717695.1 alpha/beta hydrolase [Noviherbaspirillum sp. CPCC 100848]